MSTNGSAKVGRGGKEGFQEGNERLKYPSVGCVLLVRFQRACKILTRHAGAMG